MAHAHDYQGESPGEYACYTVLPDGLELLHAHYYTHAFGRHIHDGYAVAVIERGAEQFYYRGANVVAGAGIIGVINPGEIHTGQALTQEGWSYRSFYPSLDFMQQIASQIDGQAGGIPIFAEALICHPALYHRLRRLHQGLQSTPRSLAVQSEAVEVFAELLLHHASNRRLLLPGGHNSRGVGRVRDYLRENLAENASLESLAAIAQLSPYHFLRVFRDTVGLPPHAYRNHLRIQQAKVLLRRGMSIAEVAAATGFVDQSHFTRRFKQVVGVTPARYTVLP